MVLPSVGTELNWATNGSTIAKPNTRYEVTSAGEDGDGFDVGGLGEEVEEVEVGDGVAGGGEGFEVGGEGFGRAGDVDEGGRGDAGEQCADLGAGAGAGRVEDDEAGRSRWRTAARRKSRVVALTAWRLGSLVEASAVKAGSAISTAVTLGEVRASARVKRPTPA